ncbi:MAG TPA: hypothetical protein PKK00_10040 [Bacteroidales bacterium]|mgnify:CR=1 FL=1|nr:hypothetical protein [Bacteroidales bacterium]HPS17639.1 hypothetical protein [Bacteroidales bacterium]
MKNISLVLLFIVTWQFSLFAEPIDSLKSRRELLYQKYTEKNIPGKRLSRDDLKDIVDILKDIVIVDTRIIKEFAADENELKEKATEIKNLNSEIDSIESEKNDVTGYLYVIYITGGFIIAILTIALILLVIYMSKYYKLKNKQNIYSDKLKEADSDRVNMAKLNEDISLKVKEIEMLEKKIQDYKNRNELLDEKIKTLEGSLDDLQQSDSEYNDEMEKVNINMSKIEKLGRMRELGIVTDEEFNTFKKKFLEDIK